MMIFQLPIFLVPPQDLVPYAQRVVRVMGAAALGPLLFVDSLQILKVAFSIGGKEGMRFKPNIPRYMAPSIVPSMQCLGRETAPKHNVSTSMLDGGDGVIGVIFSILPPPNAASRVDAK